MVCTHALMSRKLGSSCSLGEKVLRWMYSALNREKGKGMGQVSGSLTSLRTDRWAQIIVYCRCGLFRI